MTDKQPKALRLADELNDVAKWSDSQHWGTLEAAEAELRRQHDELDKVKQITLSDEALLRQALEALEQSETTVPYEGFGMTRREAERKHQAAIAAIKERPNGNSHP